MFEIVITENTYNSVQKNKRCVFIMEVSDVKCQKRDKEYVITFELRSNNVDWIYQLILFMYQNNPKENNRWVYENKEYLLSDETSIRRFLYDFENTDNNPLRSYQLSDVIKNKELNSIQEVRELSHQPFSGIFSLDVFDMIRLFHILPEPIEDIPKHIKVEYMDVHVKNRYITSDLKLAKGKFYFDNCILDGDIEISGSATIEFYQCLITGQVKCIDTSIVRLCSVNAKCFFLYNSNLDNLDIQFCKIYRFIFHSSSIKKIDLYGNEFVEPYIAYLNLHDLKTKIDMSQFNKKNINERMIKRIGKDRLIKIKNENNFYLTFQFEKPIESVSSNEIALEMVNIILNHGNLEKEHRLYGDMKYKKALYSNIKWRRIFVFLTGAFYVPSRWILYIICCTVLFTVLYVSIPSIQFINITTNVVEKINLWTALYYSICQIIGSNPTSFTSVGVSQIFTTLQSLLNTVFVSNFFVSLIRKFMRDEV